MRQHYVPRAYLAQFTDPMTPSGQEPYIWVYRRGKEGPSARAPKKLAVKKYYYSFSPSPGEQDHTVEEFFSGIESAALPVLRSLADGAEPSALSEEERYHFAFFIGLLSVRIPGFRNTVERAAEDVMKQVAVIGAHHPEYFERTMRAAQEAKGADPPDDIEAVRQFVLSGEYDVKADPLLSLQMLLSLAPEVADYANGCQWRMLRADSGTHFLTSDRPVVLVSTSKQPAFFGMGAGWASPWMEAVLPLSPEACLLMSLHRPEGEEYVGANVVEEVNLRMATFATDEIYSSKKVLSTIISQPADWEWWQPVSDALVSTGAEDA